MLTTLSSGQSLFFLLPTFVWGSVTDKLKSTVVGHRGVAEPMEVARGPTLTLYCPLGSLLEHKQMAETLCGSQQVSTLCPQPTEWLLSPMARSPRAVKSVPNIGVEGNYEKMRSKKETHRWPKAGGMASVKTEQTDNNRTHIN